MIQVNLIPGAKKSRGGGFSFSLPKLGGGGEGGGPDLWVLGAVAAWIGALFYIWTAYSGVTSNLEELQVREEAAVADSTRFFEQSSRIATLRARRDSINDRIAIIQEIDQGRYIWSHVMDELARALPDFTWLEAVTASSPEPNPTIEIEGNAGNQFSVSLFLQQLEASPFFEQVELISSDVAPVGSGENAQRVQNFFVEVVYRQPPFEILESVPLFDDGPGTAVNPLTSGAVADTATGGI